MAFINNQYDVTMTAPGSGSAPALLSAAANSSGKTFEQAIEKNRIYQGNGLICQQAMCYSLTGCNSKFGCPGHPDWKKVVEFCGPIGTGGMAADGSYWVLEPADAGQKLLSYIQRTTGLKTLPNPYNTVGMY